jgi:hypothetical protein
MPAHNPMRSAGLDRQDPPPIQRRLGAVAVLAAVGLLGACSSAPPLTRSDPADPGAPVRPVAYRSTIGPYTSRRPVEPKPWLEQNRDAAPADKP